MNKLTIPFGLVLLLSATAAQAQVHLGIQIGLPPIPDLVVVAPGVQVVAGFQDEVFLQGGWYWCRRPDGWYRSRTPGANFNWIEGRRVPGALMRMPMGRYHNWHRDGGMRRDGRHDEGRGHEGMGREGYREEGGRREGGGDHRRDNHHD